MFKKRIPVILSMVILTAILGACSSSADTEANTPATSEITLTESWDFSNGFYPVMTPERSTNYGIMYYAVNFYETLVNYEDGTFTPGLAESWDISTDGLVYTFHLKDNVKFSDGAAFNAEAVKKNLEAIPVLLGSYNGSYGTTSTLLDKIVAVDPLTVEIHLKNAYYGVLKDLTMINPMAMVSPNAFKEDGTLDDGLQTATLGTGPYMYSGDTDGTTYTFVKNPEYWGTEPEVDQFHVKVIADNDAKLLALRSGQVDLIVGADKISYDAYNEMKAADGYGAITSDAVSYTRLLGFNTSQAPFDDLNVRQAASYGIDKQRLSESLFSGIEVKADRVFDQSMPYTNVELSPYDYDKEKAISLLEQSGWVDQDGDGIREKKGVPLMGSILYTTGSSLMDDLALALTSQFKELGMEVKVKGMDRMAYYAETMKNDFTIILNQTYGLTYDPYTFISNMNASLKVDNFAAQALSLVPDGDQIIESLYSMSDITKIQETYDFILKEIHNQAIFLPISFVKELAVYNSKKINSYSFNGQPTSVDITKVELMK
ncbi:nickel ABC transporter substrate-binding protein [Paenibacillus rhizoplanae]|uniref:Nickel ABC transporter substrate-binding protein n=1 Tax=Paenibacillus rhizoplanae TaxID=1917181 RepID=A0ABW5FF03_9BACL